MKIANQNNITSSQKYITRIYDLVDACCSLNIVRSKEPLRTVQDMVLNLTNTEGEKVFVWNPVKGTVEPEKKNQQFDLKGDGNVSFGDAFAAIKEKVVNKAAETFLQKDPETYIFHGCASYLEDEVLIEYCRYYADRLALTNIRVFLIVDDVDLPEALSNCTIITDYDTPTATELVQYAADTSADAGITFFTDSQLEQLANAGAGMTKLQFTQHLSLGVIDSPFQTDEGGTEDEIFNCVLNGVYKGKTEVVKTDDLLELMESEDMSDVGGMANLKNWVGKRAKCYSQEALDYGIEAPKGVVFVGIPGTGKSLAAKAVGSVLQIPIVRLDFGKIFNSLVGKSEETLRRTLKMVESMSPCVLFVDEIDKGLGGTGSGSDGGVSQRVLGTFLTWMQENDKPIFVMVTANKITGLPPELLRRGRIDEIFAAGMPSVDERLEVLRIHLSKRGRDPKEVLDNDDDAVLAFVQASNDFVGAEIEQAVKNGLIDAYDAGESFNMSYVSASLETMTPMSQTYKAEIEAMIKWSANNAISASAVPIEHAPASTGEKKTSQVRRRNRSEVK